MSVLRCFGKKPFDEGIGSVQAPFKPAFSGFERKKTQSLNCAWLLNSKIANHILREVGSKFNALASAHVNPIVVYVRSSSGRGERRVFGTAQ